MILTLLLPASAFSAGSTAGAADTLVRIVLCAAQELAAAHAQLAAKRAGLHEEQQQSFSVASEIQHQEASIAECQVCRAPGWCFADSLWLCQQAARRIPSKCLDAALVGE